MYFSEKKIRNQVKLLYQRNEEIHIDLLQSRPKKPLKGEKAKIVETYLHIFVVEEYSQGKAERHSIRYADLNSEYIRIVELKMG